MKLAIISDIHANLEALETTLSIIESLNITEVVCLGDLVDYGAEPNECIQMVEKHCRIVIMGNHDEAILDINQAKEHFGELALMSTMWSSKVISEHFKQYLGRREYRKEDFNLTFVHSSPKQPTLWHYIMSEFDAAENYRHFSTPICFFGHSHIASIFSNVDENLEPSVTNPTKEICSSLYSLNPRNRYLINVGSVGQPRDFDWRLSFGIFDTETFQYELIRAVYDVQSASQKIIDAGLPQHNAKRLFIGR